MPEEIPVDNDEDLFRQVPNVGSHFAHVEGRLRLSTSAFNDSAFKPSVDRARLNGNDPKRTQKKPSDGVVKLIAQEVRSIAGVVKYEVDGREQTKFKIDVIPDPIEPQDGGCGNPAHALIVADPSIGTQGMFKKLKESLARLAEAHGWIIEPS